MDKTVLITGASQGLGYEFAKIFAKNKYNLILIARNKEKLQNIKHEIEEAYKVGVTIIVKDLSAPNSSEDIYQEINKQGAIIDVLVNNAGFATHGLFIETALQEEVDEIQVNITTVTVLTKLIVTDMIKRKSGRVLNIASTAAFQPGPLMAVYYATKAYVLSFSEALSEEFKGTGVTVTALCPEPTNTGFAQHANLLNSKLFKNSANASSVVETGYRALMKGQRVAIPGITNKIGSNLVKFIPHSILLKAIKDLQ